MKTLISSEYGLTISGHVTVLRQWLSEKNADYIINMTISLCIREKYIVNVYQATIERVRKIKVPSSSWEIYPDRECKSLASSINDILLPSYNYERNITAYP